jgi:hypothetical protein
MTPQDFRRIALAMRGAIESAHMGHPDFRVNGRIFATLRPEHGRGMVKLPPDDQQEFVRQYPAAFAPESGAWGRAGCTAVRLEAIDEEVLGEALTLAYRRASVIPRRRQRRARHS